MNLIPLLVLAGIGAWAISKRGSVTTSEPGGSSGAWTVAPVPVAATSEAAQAREDGITKVLQSASKTGNQILIAFPLRRATAPNVAALASGAEVLGYGVAQRIAQEGGERAYYVKLTSVGQLAGGKPAELSERVLDLPAIGTDYRITNAHLASIQELETLAPEAAAEPAPRTTATEPSPAPSTEPAIVKRTPVPESRRFFPAAHFGGARDPSRIRVIVLHSTEGGSASGAASWFQSEASGGSTQLVAGEDGLFRSVDDLRIPWGAQGANSDGLHIELAGYAKWSREQWLAREKTLENAASAIGQWSKKYGIPLRYIEGAELADDVTRGVTTHVAVTKAYKKGDHWDPGPGFPVDVLLERAKAYA